MEMEQPEGQPSGSQAGTRALLHMAVYRPTNLSFHLLSLR